MRNYKLGEMNSQKRYSQVAAAMGRSDRKFFLNK